jgi:hypothetical protein
MVKHETVSLHYLAGKMKQSGHLETGAEVDCEGVIGFLLKK